MSGWDWLALFKWLWICLKIPPRFKTPWGADLEVQNSAGHRLRGPKLHWTNLTPIIAPWIFGPPNLHSSNFWTPQSAPRRVLEQCNARPANSQRYSFMGQVKLPRQTLIPFSYLWVQYPLRWIFLGIILNLVLNVMSLAACGLATVYPSQICGQY